MDTARAAKRTEGVEDVTIVYRRTVAEMPADMEEYEYTLEDGIKYEFLANPTEYKNGVLTVAKMELGEPDASGRRRPIPTKETYTLPCDNIITAIASHVDEEMTNFYGLPVDERGNVIVNKETLESSIENVFLVGDMTFGPSVVVKSIASAKLGVDSLLDKILGPEEEAESCGCGDPSCDHDHDHSSDEEADDDDEEFEDEEYDSEEFAQEENEYYKELRVKKGNITLPIDAAQKDFLKNEGQRCNECSYICNKCVEVCPNRANLNIDVRNYGIFKDPFQIVHIDAYCNECGNCATFCPYTVGTPYKDKFTVFSRMDDFENSTNSGFVAVDTDITIRLDGKLFNCSFNAEGLLEGDEGVSEEVAAVIEEIYLSYSYLLGYVED
jgi:putative selenate reductase